MQFSTMQMADTRLFGTDGIRGKACEFPLDNETVFAIGSALGEIFSQKLDRKPRFVIGRDTRESGDRIRSAFCKGATSKGVDCENAGIITTPGVAFLTKQFDFDAGIVISASHNPYEDNGIKIFSPSGKKLDEEFERLIETAIFSVNDLGYKEITPPQTASYNDKEQKRQEEFYKAYIDHLAAYFDSNTLNGTKVAIDCANGAASVLAPKLFERLGAEVIVINAEPDGTNINRDCGSLHLDQLRKTVKQAGAAIGVAFDGDADRSLFVDEKGNIADGDATLWIIANQMVVRDKLANRKVVATVMSNIGLEIALGTIGVDLVRCNVGDKYVLETLLETGSELGGEQSGHIIIPENGLVGDGLMTTLAVLRAMCDSGKPLSSLASGFVRYPQVLLNVSVAEKRPFDQVERIAREKAAVETELRGTGRLLLRYSGTENLARVMIEGKDQAAIEKQAARLGAVIQNELGSASH